MANDILTYNNDLHIAQKYIVENCNINEGYIRVAKTRVKNGAQSWHYTELSGKCYFKYSKLPKTIITQLLDVHSLARMASVYHDDISIIIHNAIYSQFKLFLKDFSPEIAKSAAVIFEAANHCKINNISFSKSDFFVKLAKEIELQGLKYLPLTWRNLRDKIKEYIDGKDISEVIKVKNEGNSNASIFIKNELIKSWLIELGGSQKNYTYSFIWRKIRTACEQNRIDKTPSVRWVSDFLSKKETQILISNRFGANSRFNNKYKGYSPMASALFAGDCWDIDGTRVNITDHRTTVVKDGKRVPANKFLYIVAVRDVMSGAVLGWEYCYEENHDIIINALAMAVRNTGYLPYELRYDKFPGHNHQDWLWVEDELRRSGVVMTQTVKAEGKAHIERWWGTLQSVFMAESDFYYGEGVKSSRKYAHRAKEYVAQMRQTALKSGFNFDKACQETDKILNAYMTTKYSHYSRKYKNIDKTPTDLHNDCSKENVIEITEEKFCFLFGLKKQVSIRNYMIQTQINGATYYYGIDDFDIIEKFTGVKLINCFDYENLSKVHLYNEYEYLGTFDQVIESQQYGPKKDMRGVGVMKQIAQNMSIQKTKRVAEMIVNTYNEELEVSAEMGAMLGGRIGKHAHEIAETAMLNELWNTDEDDIKINTRSKY